MNKMKQFSSYKCIERNWIMNIPEHWKYISLKFLGIIKSGKSEPDENGEYPLYGSTGKIGFCNKPNYSGKFILIARVGANAGYCYRIDDVCGITDNTLVFEQQGDINLNYLFYYLKQYDFSKLTSGSGRPLITGNDLLNIQIILPSKSEQEQIAKYLDKKTTTIQKTITKNKKLITLLKEKRTTLINQTVTKGLNPETPMKESGIKWVGKIPEHWKISRLKFYCMCNNSSLGDDTPAEYEFNYVDIGSVSLENGIEKYEQMNFDNAPSRARRIVKENDVIISTVRTYLKAIATIQKEENTIVSTGFAVLTPKNINYKFLGYFVKSEYFTETVNSKSVGVSYPAINSSELINIEIVVPPEKEQGKISEYLDEKCDKINKTIEKIERNIELLEEYKESLIHHVVTGKIDVRGVEL